MENRVTEKCPYETLYIYEVKGIVKDPDDLCKQDFLGCWEETDEYCFLFFSRPHRQKVEDIASSQGLEYRSETIMPYSQWEAGDKIRPMRAGRFFVYPAWREPEIPKKTIPIVLDPGVAFGSGYHASTGDCLAVMTDAFPDGAFPLRVLDLGTGTGILAAAAGRAGAAEILAVELNDLSARMAKKNMELNGISNLVTVVQGRAEVHVDGMWDLVLANLTYPVLNELKDSMAFSGSEHIILSGLRPSEKTRLVPELENKDYTAMDQRQRDNWCTVYLRKCGKGE